MSVLEQTERLPEIQHSWDARERGVTPRVVALCLVLAVLLGYLVPVIDYKLFNTFLGATHLPPGAIGVLLLLVLVVNPLLRVAFERWSFSRNELLTVYISCLFSTVVPGHGAENFVIPNLLASFYLATPENGWMEQLRHVPSWMTPALNAHGQYNATVVQGWYQGLNGQENIPWGAWMLPLCFWGVFVFTSYVMLGCLSVMLRAQWSDREVLSFPLLRLPLAITEGGDASIGGFFRNRVMWLGFGLVVFVQLVRGLNLYFPDVPPIPLELDVSGMLSESPWNQIGGLHVQCFPVVVGVAYLLTTEVSFSLWFFFLFLKLQYVGAYLLGYMPAALPDATGAVPGKAFTGMQMIGAYLAYVGFIAWSGRSHFGHILRRALGRTPARAGEAQEALPYPAAFWGFCGGFLALVAMSMLAGVRWDLAVVLWGSYIVFAIGLTRIAAESGMLFLLHDSAPLGVAGKLMGNSAPHWLSLQNGLAPASFFQAGLVVHMRGFSMPSFLHSFKLASDRGISARPLLALIFSVLAISLGMSFWMVVRLGYENGGLTLGHRWYTQIGSLWPINFMQSVSRPPQDSLFVTWGAVGVGIAVTALMVVARGRFPWFPLHPVGYLMCVTFPAYMFWFSIGLAWLCKVLVTRFGGHEAYRKTVPFFLGVALGDITMMLFWLAVDGWFGRVGHQLMPG